MPRALLLAVPVLVLACSSSPPAVTPEPTPQPMPAPTVDWAAVNAQQAQQRAAEDAAMAPARALAAAEQQRQTQESATVAGFRKRCEDSRADRLEHVKLMVAGHLNAESKLLENAKAIRGACKLTEKATGAARVQGAGGSLRVSPEMRDDVQCSKALPKGVTKDDAYVLLFRDRAGEKGPSGTMLASEDHSPDDGPCQTFDKEVGLNLEPRWDTPDLDALRAWGKPKP